MQTTYLKQTASTILKTARIEQMKAGQFEIVVTVPKLGDCHAHLGTRRSGWGGDVADVLFLENFHGDRLYLATNAKSLATLESLCAQRESQQVAFNQVA